MNDLEFENMILGTNKKEESIMEQPVWDVRCWLEELNQGEYLKVIKDGKVYVNADELFWKIVSYREYERSIKSGNVLTVVYKNGDIIELEGVNKNILEEVKKDIETIRNKRLKLEYYNSLYQIIDEVPLKYRDCFKLDGDYLCIDYEIRIKLNNLVDVDIIDLDNRNMVIVIHRKHGEPVRIEFKHGKNEQTKKYGYIDFSIEVGY